MVSDIAKQKLDEALAACAEHGITIFGAMVSDSEYSTFMNGTDSVEAWMHNMKTIVQAVEESLQNKHEA